MSTMSSMWCFLVVLIGSNALKDYEQMVTERSPRVLRAAFVHPMATPFLVRRQSTNNTRAHRPVKVIPAARRPIVPPMVQLWTKSVDQAEAASRTSSVGLNDTKHSRASEKLTPRKIMSGSPAVRSADLKALSWFFRMVHPNQGAPFPQLKSSKEVKGLASSSADDRRTSKEDKDRGYKAASDFSEPDSSKGDMESEQGLYQNDYSGRSKHPEGDKEGPHFRDYQQVLKAIGKNDEELRLTLRMKGSTLYRFLTFIENGATREDMLQYLNHNGSEKHPNSKLYHKNTNDKLNLKQGTNKSQLDDLYFTEIVHDVPLGQRLPLDSYVDLLEEEENIFTQDGTRETGASVKKLLSQKRHKVSKKKHQDKIKTEVSAGDQSPKARDAIAGQYHEKPEKGFHDHASIFSVSVEEKPVSDSSFKVNDDNRSNLRFPSKPVSLDHKAASEFTSPATEVNDKFTFTTLRIKYPLRGLLIFSGVLGAMAVFTTVIIIIYAVLKCSEKPADNNYSANDQKESST